MKKSILLFLLCFATFQISQAQKITQEDYKSIIPFLQAEDWKSAYKMSSKLLEKASADTSEYKTMVVYFNIYAAAGMTSENKMNRNKLKEVVDKYKGQPIFMAGHLASKDGKNTLNKTFLSTTDGKSNGFTIVTNRALKIILLEDIALTKQIDPAFYAGSTVRCGGILKELEVNPDKNNNDWIIKLTISNGFIRRTK